MSNTTNGTTIEATMKLKDQMTPKLFKLSKHVNGLHTEILQTSRDAVKMASKFSAGVNKMVGKAAGLALQGKAMQAYIKGIGALVQQADAYAEIQSKLSYINDGSQTAAQLNDKLFASADRARVSYESIAATVGKLGLVAKKAFTGNDEMIQFSELMAKGFKIAGISTEEQSAAMEQLTQAMAKGTLQGDQFQSILQSSPVLAEAIGKEMGVSVEQLKGMAEEGKITSDVIKNALFHSAGDINERFSQLPMTFGEATQKIKNTLTNKLQPTFEKMSSWLNSAEGETMLASIGDGIMRLTEKLPAVISALEFVFGIVKGLYNFAIRYQDIIIGIGMFVVVLVGLTKAVTLAKLAFHGLKSAGVLLNASMALSPFGWIAIAIAGVVAAGVLLWKNWDTIKVKAFELWTELSRIFGIIGDAIGGAFTAVKGVVDEVFTWIFDQLESLSKTLKGLPGIGLLFTGDNLNDTDGGRVSRGNALGTSYWRGGLTYINERGGEIVDLPNGSRVIPADKSQRMLDGRTNNVTINISGMSKSTAEIMGELVPQLKLAMANM